jgi:hypothetical protein
VAQKELDKLVKEGRRRIKTNEILTKKMSGKSVVVRGGERYTLKKYWADVLDFPRTWKGAAFFGVIFLGVHYYSFSKFLEEQKFTESQERELNDALMKNDQIKRKLRVFERYQKGPDEPLDTTILNASKEMSEDEFNKNMEELQSAVDVETAKIEKTYNKGAEKLYRLSKINSLANVYNNICYVDPIFKPYHDTYNITVTGERTEKQKNDIKNYIEKKEWKKKKEGFEYKDSIIVIIGIYKGVYKKKSGEWENIINNCKLSGNIIKEYCKSPGKKWGIKSKTAVKDFCVSIEYGDVTEETFNDIFLDHFGGDEELHDLFD